MGAGTTELIRERSVPEASPELANQVTEAAARLVAPGWQSVPVELPVGVPVAVGGSFKRRFARDLIRGFAIVAFLHIFVLQVSVVRGHSMQPCLVDGDRLVVDRLSYAFADVSRFDVVVLRNPRDTSVDYVKRIVGLPGDDVRLQRGKLYVNGERMDESFGPISDRDTTRTYHIPKGRFFVLGDNRPVSSDSREFGLVDAKLLKGRVRLRFWPLDRFALL